MTVALAARQVAYEQRSFWRNPAAAFFTFVFPLMFLVIFNTLFGNAHFYIPAIVTFSVISACYTNVAMGVTIARDGGILKRVRGTPLPPWAYLAGRIGSAVVVAVILVAIVTAAGALVYGVEPPALAGLLVTLAVGAAAFAALGLAVSGLVPNADAAPAVVNATILPLMFFSDVFIPLDDPARWVEVVGDLFPVKHLSLAMQAVYGPSGAPDAGHLAVVALWGAVGALVASRTFSWEARR